MSILLVLLVAVAAGMVLAYAVVRSRNMQYWLPGYLRYRLRQLLVRSAGPRHVYLCIGDHYEPYWGKPGQEKARARVKAWRDRFPELAMRYRDSNGRHPVHTFFYPEEEYDEVVINWLREICDQGVGDVEIHLHHDNDTADNLRKTLAGFARLLHDRHGFLREEGGQLKYAFIHGNWALDNSRPDGRWCGVNNELEVLRETGCYVDMTMPSAPSDTQTATVNSIYFAKGRPGQCKSHNTGVEAAVGRWTGPDELLMIQGPLMLNWKSRKFGLLPRIEAGELSADAPPTRERINLWLKAGVSVRGAEDHIFIKLHTHGAEDANVAMFLDGGFETLWQLLEDEVCRKRGWSLHYVSARDMYLRVQELCQMGAAGSKEVE